MGIFGTIFGYPLGFIMWLVYAVFKNYGVSIVLFTLITRLIILPLSVKQQRSTASMQAIQPKLERLKKQYANNQEKLNEETMKLYTEENINPMASCLPTLIQFPILFGIIDVVYRPITHILHVNKDIISKATEIAQAYFVNEGNNFKSRPELYIIKLFNMDPSQLADLPELTEKLASFKNTLFGLDLGLVPNIVFDAEEKARMGVTSGQAAALFLIPILSGVFQLAITIYSQIRSKKMNPDSSANPMGGAMAMLYIMPIFSVWIAYSFPAGIGFYWIVSSFLSLIQTIVLNKIYTPEYVAKLDERDREKKKSKKPGRMQEMYKQMLEQQQAQLAQQNGGAAPKKELTAEQKISKSKQQELESKIIAEARRRQAEKYGDEYNENDD